PKALQEPGSRSGQKKTKQRRRRFKAAKVKARARDPRRTLLHLWFAKRFKFDSKWNRLIPYKNNCKNQRILYRCSKRGYTVFYLPFMKSLLLDYSKVTRHEVLSVLAHFCSEDDYKLLQGMPDDHQSTIYLYS